MCVNFQALHVPLQLFRRRHFCQMHFEICLLFRKVAWNGQNIWVETQCSLSPDLLFRLAFR